MNSFEIADNYSGINTEDAFDVFSCGACPVCGRRLPDHHVDWRMPHPVAFSVHPEDAWVCSDGCAAEWLEDMWEYVDEWMLERSDLHNTKQELLAEEA